MASTSESTIVTGVRRDDQPATSLIMTPIHEPNIIYQTITPIMSILIRSARVFVQTLLSGSGLSLAGAELNIETVKHLQAREILILAAAAAAVCALQNTGELLARLDQKFPLMRGA
jgi:hypothetical protein